eukprot:1150340-Pelagomonas_calceolata.AAC.1
MVSKALRLNVLNRHPQIPKKMLERLQEACRQARRLARTSPRRRTWRSKLMCVTLNCFMPPAGAKMSNSAVESASVSTTFCLGTSWRCRSMPGQSLAGNLGEPQSFDPEF